MSRLRHWKLGIALLALTLVTSVACVREFYWSLTTAFADEQTDLFYYFLDEVRSGRLSADAGADAVRSYYGSGSKQVAGSTLDRVVERVRERVLDDIERLKAIGIAEPEKALSTRDSDERE